MLFAPFTELIDAWAHGGKAIVGKIAYNLAGIKMYASNGGGHPCGLHHHSLAVGQGGRPISVRNIFDQSKDVHTARVLRTEVHHGLQQRHRGIG